MNKLEDITVGSTVKVIAGTEPVSIVAAQWYGSNVLEITYKDTRGVPETQLLYRESEPGLEVLSKHLPWSFDADAEQWQGELFSKLHLKFEILTNDRMKSAVTGNIFTEVDRCICRLDKLARSDDLQEKLKASEWDLIAESEILYQAH